MTELTKSCSKCKEVKPYSAFSPTKGDPMRPRSRCKPCQAQTTRLHNRGVTEAEFAQLMDRAEHRCEACGTTAWLAIDHNHETGEVRGILCRRCNGVLGMMKEDAKALKKLANYLKKRR